MAKSSSPNSLMFFYLVVILSFLLLLSIAESRSFIGFGLGKQATIECDSVYGVSSGDTCFAVTQMFNLTTDAFDSINPNLNCSSLFVGQWLCVDGFTS